MPLFKIQDDDRPMWVAAADYADAIASWFVIVAKENELPIAEVEPPMGVQYICNNYELVVDRRILDDLRAAKDFS